MPIAGGEEALTMPAASGITEERKSGNGDAERFMLPCKGWRHPTVLVLSLNVYRQFVCHSDDIVFFIPSGGRCPRVTRARKFQCLGTMPGV